MKVLVTGSGGMVGTALKKVLEPEYELICPTKYQLNVCNIEAYGINESGKVDAIVHLSCETDHEYCQVNPSNAYYVNTIGTANMVEIAERLDIPIIYVSTASVFNGEKKKPYTTEDKPNPINHYNKSKYYGEILTQRYEKHYILRAGWLFGGGKSIDKKFVNKIMTKVYAGHKKILVANDCIGSPTHTEDLAFAIGRILKGGRKYGIYHAVNDCQKGASRYDVAVEIKEILKLKNVEIIPESIDCDILKAEFPCKRTYYEVLEPNVSLRDWRVALARYLDDKYRH